MQLSGKTFHLKHSQSTIHSSS